MDVDKFNEILATACGTELRQLRNQLQLSQEHLAFDAGVHRTYISLVERGRKIPTLNTFFKICKALGAKPEDVVSSIRQRIDSE